MGRKNQKEDEKTGEIESQVTFTEREYRLNIYDCKESRGKTLGSKGVCRLEKGIFRMNEVTDMYNTEVSLLLNS